MALLKPGQRVDLIRAASQDLARRSWDDVWLILGQFKVPHHTWHWDSLYEFSTQALIETTDAQLQELYAYLVGEQQEHSNEITPWTAEGLRLFVNHLATHHVMIGQVAEHMAEFGVECFVAHRDIAPSREVAV